MISETYKITNLVIQPYNGPYLYNFCNLQCTFIKTAFFSRKIENGRPVLALRDIWWLPLARQLLTNWFNPTQPHYIFPAYFRLAAELTHICIGNSSFIQKNMLLTNV